MTSRIPRRSFLRWLGAGAGSALLGSVARGIVSTAKAESTRRKCFVLVVVGQGISEHGVRPAGLGTGAILPGTTSYELPPMLRGLAAHRDRMLIVDGLSNRMPAGQHTGGYAALSGFTAAGGASNEAGGPPGGITIDQFIASRIGNDTPFRSVLAQLNGNRRRVGTFASGIRRPAPSLPSASQMWSRLFGDALAPQSAVSGNAIMDGLRSDLGRVRSELRGYERLKLDHYEAALDEFSRRMSRLGMFVCPSVDAPGTLDPEDELGAMFDMGAVALTCGLTNVLCLGLGLGHGHGGNEVRFRRLPMGSPYEADFPDGVSSGMGHLGSAELIAKHHALVYGHVSEQIGRLVDALRATPVDGGGTLFDDTTIVWTSDNGNHHHSQHDLYPCVVVGDAGGALRADGRYLRYDRPGGERGPRRALADLFTSVATAVGAGTDNFGEGGLLPVEGPLAEIMR